MSNGKPQKIDPKVFDVELTTLIYNQSKKKSIKKISEENNFNYRDLLAYIKYQDINLKPEFLTEEGKQQVALYLLQNPQYTNAEIQKKFGISETTLLRIKKKYNIPKKSKYGKSKPVLKNEKKAIEYLKTTDMPAHEIGKLTGLSKSTINDLKNKHNIRRPKPLTLSNIPSDQINAIIDQYPQATLRELSEKIGWSASQLSRHIKAHPEIKYKPKRIRK